MSSASSDPPKDENPWTKDAQDAFGTYVFFYDQYLSMNSDLVSDCFFTENLLENTMIHVKKQQSARSAV